MADTERMKRALIALEEETHLTIDGRVSDSINVSLNDFTIDELEAANIVHEFNSTRYGLNGRQRIDLLNILTSDTNALFAWGNLKALGAVKE